MRPKTHKSKLVRYGRVGDQSERAIPSRYKRAQRPRRKESLAGGSVARGLEKDCSCSAKELILPDVREGFSGYKVVFVAAIYGVICITGSLHPPND